jgi:hypothetical protein
MLGGVLFGTAESLTASLPCAMRLRRFPTDVVGGRRVQIAGPADLDLVGRRRAEDPGVVVAEQMEATHQVFVEDGHLTIEHQDVGPELRDRRRETRGTDSCDEWRCERSDGLARRPCRRACATRRLFLVHPAVTMEGRADERRGHGDDSPSTALHLADLTR